MEIGKQGLRKQILRKGTNSSWQSPSRGDEVRLQGTYIIIPMVQLELQLLINSLCLQSFPTYIIQKLHIINVSVHFSGLVKEGAPFEYDDESSSSAGHHNINGASYCTAAPLLCFKLGQCTQHHCSTLTHQRIASYCHGHHHDYCLDFSGEVIKGLEEGVGTMQRGERAVLTIPPNLAYGELGSPPFVPPASALLFDIELLSWTTITDLTGDGGLFKKITRDGHGWATPRDADQVLGLFYINSIPAF